MNQVYTEYQGYTVQKIHLLFTVQKDTFNVILYTLPSSFKLQMQKRQRKGKDDGALYIKVTVSSAHRQAAAQ